MGLFLLSMTAGCALTRSGEPKSAGTTSNSNTETEIKSQNTQILKLSQAGEYKSVVDIADALIKGGHKCSGEVAERIYFSRSQLYKADAHVLEALRHKREGKLLDAQANLLMALEIYPKYYWAQNLLKKVERSINAQTTGLKKEAHNLEADGNLDGALSLVQDAVALSPGDNDLKLEATRLQNTMNMLLQEEREQKHFEKMLVRIDSVLCDEIKKLLHEEAAAKRLGEEGVERLQVIRDRRQSIIKKGLLAAQKAEQKDDLESAADHTMYVLELSSAGEPLTSDIVKFARLLGLKLFSTGDFSKARDLWKGALDLAPDNVRLQKYLAEVEESLDNLKKIQPPPPHLSSL